MSESDGLNLDRGTVNEQGTDSLQGSAAAHGLGSVSALRWLPLVLGCVLSPIFCWIAFMSAGMGRGDYVWARILLPVVSLVGADPPIWVAVMLGLLQWPLYGLLLSLYRMQWQVWVVLLVAHAAMVLLLFG